VNDVGRMLRLVNLLYKCNGTINEFPFVDAIALENLCEALNGIPIFPQ
jgi:hypothetical protein